MKTSQLYKISWHDGFPVVSFAETGEIARPVKKLLAGGDANTKLRKNTAVTSGLSLSPHQSAGIGNVCAHASIGCIEACLDGQGLGSVFHQIHVQRIARTALWYQERSWFLDKLAAELTAGEKRATRKDSIYAVRLNVFSDIAWELHGDIVDSFPRIEFYDYTKDPRRVGAVRPNYWVTFSRSESNEALAIAALKRAQNVAIAFADTSVCGVANRAHHQRLPKSWRGFPVIDGDKTDMRFDDPRGRTRGRVVGLRLKAHSYAVRDAAISSGFAIEVKS